MDSFNSLIPEDLDPACEYVVQNEWTEYTEFLEQAATRRSSSACMREPNAGRRHEPHDLGGTTRNLWFNGTLVGETGINAALCGTWGCPVLMVTGDEASCREGRELLGGGLTTVAVKKGFGAAPERESSLQCALGS